MPAQSPTVGSVLGAIFGTLGLSALAGLLVTVMVAPAIAVTGATANSTIGIFDSLPEYVELNQGSQQNRIVAMNGEEQLHIATIYYQNREEIALEDMSPHLVHAAIAGEDPRFEGHGGVDLPSVIRAGLGVVAGDQDAGGASTITMQTVRNILIMDIVNNPDYDIDRQNQEIREVTVASFDRKLREMKFAIGLEKRYTKDEILQGYLNIAGFGGNTYGVQAAAQEYFSKSASDLTVAEAASLIAIVQYPNARNLSKEENYERNEIRRNYIVRAMHSEGYITTAERDEALNTPVDEDFVRYAPPQSGCLAASAPYRFPCDYAERLVPKLEALGDTEQERRNEWRKGGYTLVLSIDPTLQEAATTEAQYWAPGTETRLDLGAAVSSVQVGTGRILVMAQNKDFDNRLEGGGPGTTAVNYNADFPGGGSRGFQPGSTWKPYVLLAFLDAGHGINETFDAGLLEMPMTSFQDCNIGGAHGGAPYKYRNDAGENGPYTVQRGTAESVNSVFIQMAADVDQCRISELAASIGVHRADGASDGSDLLTNPSCSIGGCDNNTAPLTQAAAYAAIANQGYYCAPVMIDRIISPRGDDLPGQTPECGQSLVTPDVANTAAYAMESVMGGTAAASNTRDGIPYFGKTGTTDQSVHTWMVGSSTSVSTAVWVGNVVGKVALRNVSVNGTSAAVLRHRIFLPVAREINARYGGTSFPGPAAHLVTGTPVYVPSGLIGLTAEAAQLQIELAELRYQLGGSIDSDLPAGVVAMVTPGEGEAVSRGTEVVVWTSNGEAIPVPDVSDQDLSFEEAEEELNEAGFAKVKEVCVEAAPGDPVGSYEKVVAQNPAADTVVNRSTVIELSVRRVSCSPPQPQQPVSRGLGAVAAAGFGAAAALGAGALAWGVLVERVRWTVRRETLPILPPGARPITVLHLSDLHLAPWQRSKIDFVRSLARVEPDLIVDTGDNLGHPDAIPALADALAPFRGVPGVFAHGSNDYLGPVLKNPLGYLWSPSRGPRKGTSLDTARMERLFTDDLGWNSLENSVHSLELNGTAIEFAGTGDAHQDRDELEHLPAAVEALRESASWSETVALPPLTIGVTHAPYRRVLDALVTEGASLIFAGHTHGGQVRVPGLPALVTNCDLPREQAQGLSVWRHAGRSALLQVSAGLGTSIYAPVRFACPPEAVVVTLTEVPPEIGYP